LKISLQNLSKRCKKKHQKHLACKGTNNISGSSHVSVQFREKVSRPEERKIKKQISKSQAKVSDVLEEFGLG
jgi:hypothetical protein